MNKSLSVRLSALCALVALSVSGVWADDLNLPRELIVSPAVQAAAAEQKVVTLPRA